MTGLFINFRKFKILSTFPNTQKVEVENKKIEIVPETIYFGQLISLSKAEQKKKLIGE